MLSAAALTMGLLGSLHCLGMCGPIALMVPVDKNTWWRRSIGGLSYNLGRVATYGILGAIFGLLGLGIHLAGAQQWLSISLGMLIILAAVIPMIFRKRVIGSDLGPFSRLIDLLKASLGKLISRRSPNALFTIGLLNGLLPCGLVYIAIAGATATGSIAQGTLFMVFFGLGTLPAMFAVNMVGHLLSVKARNRLRKIIPVAVIVLGLLFIVRGMNLGIPYLSPQLSGTELPMKCH
jgi:sulfite exporter TauE/SafE